MSEYRKLTQKFCIAVVFWLNEEEFSDDELKQTEAIRWVYLILIVIETNITLRLFISKYLDQLRRTHCLRSDLERLVSRIGSSNVQDWFDLYKSAGATEIDLIPVLISVAYDTVSEDTRQKMVKVISSKIEGADLSSKVPTEDIVLIFGSLFGKHNPKLYLAPNDQLETSVDRSRRMSLSEQVELFKLIRLTRFLDFEHFRRSEYPGFAKSSCTLLSLHRSRTEASVQGAMCQKCRARKWGSVAVPRRRQENKRGSTGENREAESTAPENFRLRVGSKREQPPPRREHASWGSHCEDVEGSDRKRSPQTSHQSVHRQARKQGGGYVEAWGDHLRANRGDQLQRFGIQQSWIAIRGAQRSILSRACWEHGAKACARRKLLFSRARRQWDRAEKLWNTKFFW